MPARVILPWRRSYVGIYTPSLYDLTSRTVSSETDSAEYEPGECKEVGKTTRKTSEDGKSKATAFKCETPDDTSIIDRLISAPPFDPLTDKLCDSDEDTEEQTWWNQLTDDLDTVHDELGTVEAAATAKRTFEPPALLQGNEARLKRYKGTIDANMDNDDAEPDPPLEDTLARMQVKYDGVYNLLLCNHRARHLITRRTTMCIMLTEQNEEHPLDAEAGKQLADLQRELTVEFPGESYRDTAEACKKQLDKAIRAGETKLDRITTHYAIEPKELLRNKEWKQVPLFRDQDD